MNFQVKVCAYYLLRSAFDHTVRFRELSEFIYRAAERNIILNKLYFGNNWTFKDG